ncbi:MAG: hypothetical protein IT186_00295 [Acidobacteria bacterium]|nr:hypothetical protein [Acidobacteriota bacterium]MCG3192544.1 hypothetical protein [Thermoanaerobaculia bacterium]
MPHSTLIETLVGPPDHAFTPRLCRTPGCDTVVTEAWEESGTLCANCAVTADLSDRYGRWERSFPVDWSPEELPAA